MPATVNGRALNLQCVAGLFLQVLGQQIAQHHFRLAVAEAAARLQRERVKLVGIGLPAVGQRIDLRRQVHQVQDHRVA